MRGKISDFLYRFRSMDALLGENQELERQEIYLARPEELNDPMEGYKDVFWLGDAVLWRNLLRNYMLCLVAANIECLLIPDESRNLPTIRSCMTLADLPTKVCDLVQEATDSFFSNRTVAEVLRQLSSLKLPLRRDGLLFYFTIVHLLALRSVSAALVRHGLASSKNALEESDGSEDTAATAVKQMGDALTEITTTNVDDGNFEMVLNVMNRVSEQLKTTLMYNHRNGISSRKRSFLLGEFPNAYLDNILKSIIYPQWLTACFSLNCTNASMWSTYGGHHTGCVLKFKTRESGVHQITARRVIGSSSSQDEPESKLIFHKISYTNRAPEVDFFRFLGQLSLPKIQYAWLSDEQGNRSERLASAFKDIETGAVIFGICFMPARQRSLGTGSMKKNFDSWYLIHSASCVATENCGITFLPFTGSSLD